MKKLMLGNEAVARGIYEAGAGFASSYPGTPSTEITEELSKYNEVYCEWAPNEKVALEASIGASTAGQRAFSAMKHVGLNVAADPLFTSSYIGVNAGLLIAVADDPGMHSSQNEQDSRHYARSAKLPMLEPSNSAECLYYAKTAYELSEKFDTPVLLRLSTRIAHSQSIVEVGERENIPLKDYVKDMQKRVMMPAQARGRHIIVEKRLEVLQEYAETASFNKIEFNDKKIGIISAGSTYNYAKEALGDKASYLKLGIVWPLPKKLIADFASKVETLYVVEELDDFIESFVRAMGIKVKGKDVFSLLGEYTTEDIREKILNVKIESTVVDSPKPPRPPVMCAGCPHRGLFYILKKMNLTVFGDIGCYTLGALPPISAMDFCLCMGASISGLHGFDKVRGAGKSVAVIGDSTFMHSGITGLIDIVYNKGNSTVIILDNRITGMTGHQQNPSTGITLKNEPTNAVNIEAVVRAIGIKRVVKVDPADLEAVKSALEQELAANEPSVIITERPCALLKSVKRGKIVYVNDKCRGCKVCIGLGCPAISMNNGKATVDSTACAGCGLCSSVCQFKVIENQKE